jgi:hypothetical protein
MDGRSDGAQRGRLILRGFINPDLLVQTNLKGAERPSRHAPGADVMYSREILHQYFLAECGSCGFTVEGEMRNGYGGWKEYDCSAFSRQCTHRTAHGRPTMVCPHLRAAKLAAQPMSNTNFLARLNACIPRESDFETQELAPVA